MRPGNKLKVLTGYRKETPLTRTAPVRGADGKPAKHLEVVEHKLLVTEGWWHKVRFEEDANG